MFEQYFSLKFNPFDKEIPSKDIFVGEDTKEVESRLSYLKHNRGIALLVGDPGVGKSTTLRRFADSLNPALYRLCYFTLSTVTVSEFYYGLAVELGEEPSHKKVTLFKQIQNSILTMYNDQKITPVIILDEIHLASNKLLEELRLIFSFKMDSINPFILILSGQPLIRNKLTYNVNTPLRQRICIKYIMKGLLKDEIPSYIKSRMELSGGNADIFSPKSFDIIYSVTKGYPRVINSLVTYALMYAYSKKSQTIDDETIYQAQKELNI